VPAGSVAPSSLRSQGFATVAALAPVADPVAEARRLGCSHILRGAIAVPLPTEG
jgi:ATP phosphoribosyltransferase regulatory subunit